MCIVVHTMIVRFTYLRLQIDGEKSVADRGDNKTHKTEPYGGNPQDFEDRELLTRLGSF